MTIATRAEIEAALDGGKLFVRMKNGNWWKARRNGKTQLWKTRPADYSIPIKMGLRYCDRLTPNWDIDGDFRIEADNPR